MQSNQQFIIDKIVPVAVKITKMIQLECDNLDIAAPSSIKHALLVNTVHGMFSTMMERSDNKVISAFYSMIANELMFEKDTLLLVAADFEKRNNDPLKQSDN